MTHVSPRTSGPAVRVCFCSSNTPTHEPRFVRQAAALAAAHPDWEVVVVACIPQGRPDLCPPFLASLPNVVWRPCHIPWRGSGRVRLLREKGRHALSKLLFRAAGVLTPAALSQSGATLNKTLGEIHADVYVGSSIDALIPVSSVARAVGAKVVFDCMEFYSDMGDSQTALHRNMVRAAEGELLPRCDLVLASSPQVADALKETYGLKALLPLYNAPPVHGALPADKAPGFSLYWRNGTIGISQRGLGDVLAAMQGLPDDVSLHIRGRLPTDGGAQLRKAVADLGLTNRVQIHPPHAPEEAVTAASRYHVGLCPEREGPLNQALTVSNKLFDFLMAGLPVVTSDLPGIRAVVERSQAGLTYRSCDVSQLRDRILTLYRDRELLSRLSRAARAFALSEGNLEHEMARFVGSVTALVKGRA